MKMRAYLPPWLVLLLVLSVSAVFRNFQERPAPLQPAQGVASTVADCPSPRSIYSASDYVIKARVVGVASDSVKIESVTILKGDFKDIPKEIQFWKSEGQAKTFELNWEYVIFLIKLNGKEYLAKGQCSFILSDILFGHDWSAI